MRLHRHRFHRHPLLGWYLEAVSKQTAALSSSNAEYGFNQKECSDCRDVPVRGHLDLTAEVVLKVTCPGVNGVLRCRRCKVPCQCIPVLCAGGSWFPSPGQSGGKSRESWRVSAPPSATLDVSYLPSVQAVVGEGLSPGSRQAVKPTSAPVPQLPTPKLGKAALPPPSTAVPPWLVTDGDSE